VGYSSSTNGQHKVYLACDREFFDGWLAEKGFTYVEVERSAFKVLDTFDECMTKFNEVRSLSFHLEKSGEAFREDATRAKPQSEMSRQNRKFDSHTDKTFIPKGTCRHCGRTIQFGSVREHESKCATARS
jgi:hypothetical protein